MQSWCDGCVKNALVARFNGGDGRGGGEEGRVVKEMGGAEVCTSACEFNDTGDLDHRGYVGEGASEAEFAAGNGGAAERLDRGLYVEAKYSQRSRSRNAEHLSSRTFKNAACVDSSIKMRLDIRFTSGIVGGGDSGVLTQAVQMELGQKQSRLP